MKIASCSNPKIKAVLEIKRRKSAAEQSLFLIEGSHLIEMALSAKTLIREVFFTDSFIRKKDGEKLLERLSHHTAKLYEVTDSVLHKITETETPQGITAVAMYSPLSLTKVRLEGNPLLAVSDGIQDPGNLGAIIRTADAAGADAVIILPGTCDVTLQKTIRATAGSLFNIPVVHVSEGEFLAWLRTHKIQLAVTAADAENSFLEARLDGPLALVFGNEARGVQTGLKRAADMMLSIPIYGKAESLNVAAAAAVLLYEAVRQRKYASRLS